MNKACLLIFLLLVTLVGCKSTEHSDQVISMQVIDRNGFTETISSSERLKPYQRVNYLSAQPYQKVLRVFGKNEEGKSLSKLTSYHGNGGVWQYLEAVDGRAHGQYLEWHENGKLKIQSQVIEGLADLGENAKRSWLFDQECTVWDSEGNLEASFIYDKGLLSGQAKYYYPSGQLKKEIAYEKGLADGPLNVFDADGHVSEQMFYKQGEKNGAAQGFWKPGVSKYQEQYRNGLLINGVYFDAKGEILSEITEGEGRKALFENQVLSTLIDFRDGRPAGKVEQFAPSGALERSFCLQSGQKTGEEWVYYPSDPRKEASPKMMITWAEDKIEGMCKTWYPNGTLESQKEMCANKKHGLSFAYYQSGELMLMEEYEMDKLKEGSYYRKGDLEPVSTIQEGTGTATLYNPQGQFQKKIAYEQSEVVLD